jgi:hypothetical protein
VAAAELTAEANAVCFAAECFVKKRNTICDHRSITSLSRSSDQQHALPISSSPQHCAALGPILSSRSWHYYIHRPSRLHHIRRSR